MKLQQEFDRDRRSFAGALLTTYVFNSTYFEGTLLPILRRKSVLGDTVVCLDTGAYQETTAATDNRPKRAGDEYQLAPIRLQDGRFHPKVHLFGADDRAMGFVGSANLTGAAFDQNQEIVARFDVSRSDESGGPDRDALAGVHRFFKRLIEHPVAEAMGDTAVDEARRVLEATDWLRDDRGADTTTGASSAVLHNLDRSLVAQVRDRIRDQGDDIQEVDIIAPFYGGGLSVPETFTDQGIPTTVWLQQGQTQIDDAKLRTWEGKQAAANAIVYNHDRYVHGKVLLWRTPSAVYCLAGSPNASRAALLSAPGDSAAYANIEVALFRRIPEPDHYDTLVEAIATDRVDDGLEAFAPQTADEYTPPDPTPTETVNLLSIEFTESNVDAGGRLTGRVRIPAEVTQDAQLELQIQPTTDADALSLAISGTELLGDDTDKPDWYRFSRRILEDSHLAVLTKPAAVVPVWDGTPGSERWIAIHSPNVEREARTASENDGVDAVWRTVYTMFLGDEDERAEQLEFLGALASRLDSDGESTTGHSDGQKTDGTRDELSGEPSLPPYSGTTSTSDPGNQLEGYYRTWVDHLRKLRHAIRGGNGEVEQLYRLAGERLAEINRTNTWMRIVHDELQEQYEESEDFPSHLPREYTNRLYSQTEPGFGTENTSVTAQFVHETLPVLAESEHRYLQTHIGANILFGRLVAEKLLAKDRTVFEKHYGSDFETLLSACFPDESIDARNTEVVSMLTDALWNQFGDLPSTLEDATLTTEPPGEYVEKQATHRFVKSRL